MPKLNAPAPKLSPMRVIQGKSLPSFKKGTVYVVEFWATWCGPCVKAIPHMNDLASSLKGQPVEFYSVTKERPDDVLGFMKKHPFTTNVLSDTSGGTTKAFGVQVIPRTAIIDQSGNLITVTSPDEITLDGLKKVLAHKPAKFATAFNKISSFDWDEDIAKTSLSHIIIQPSDSDGGGSKFPPGSGRLTADGVYPQVLVSLAYDAGFNDVQWEFEPEPVRYRLSVKALDGKNETVRSMLADAIRPLLSIEPTWEMVERDVRVISRTSGPLKLTPTAGPSDKGFAHGGEIIWPNCTVDKICSLLQDFVFGKPVINETGDTGRYDIHLKWIPGDKQSVNKMLADIGLSYKDDKRPVRTLVVRKKANS